MNKEIEHHWHEAVVFIRNGVSCYFTEAKHAASFMAPATMGLVNQGKSDRSCFELIDR